MFSSFEFVLTLSLISLVRMLLLYALVEFPISAHGGCPCLFAFGLRPLFCLVGSCFVLFLSA